MRGELSAQIGELECTATAEPSGRGLWRVRIDDRTIPIDAVEIKPGSWSLLIDGFSHLVDVDDSASPPVFHIAGHANAIELENALRKRLAAQLNKSGAQKNRGEVIKAPIAGRVVSILVKVGQHVESGTCVAILEAMKMENEIKCSHTGVIESIHSEAGASIDTGAKLLTIAAVTKDPAPESL